MQIQRASQTRTPEISRQTSPAISIAPPPSPVHPILDLQQTIGNRAVQRALRSRAIQPKLAISQPGDIYEREADRVAERVMRMPEPVVQRTCAACTAGGSACSKCETEKQGLVQRKTDNAAESTDSVPEGFLRNLGPGQPLDPATRAFFEPRFGYDFSRVRVHTGGAAEQSARDVSADAYTVGHNVVFGADQFAPGTHGGRRLLAHELAHVGQQGAASHADNRAKRSLPGLRKQSSSGDEHRGQMVQRAPIEILPADFVGPPNTDQRSAAASCDIGCDATSLGTLHAMPTFFHASRGAPLASSSGADGIGTSLHFIRNGTSAPAKSACSTCTDFKIIQVLNSNEPADSRGKESFVDNAASSTPFYGDVYRSGAGLHPIPTGYPDAGSDVRTTHSIYDRPFRDASRLGIVTGKDFFWNAEACVTCIRPGKDKVLGCATYGFKRDWDKKKSSHGPVQTVGPGCLAKPSSHFVTTLTTDSSTSSYKFET